MTWKKATVITDGLNHRRQGKVVSATYIGRFGVGDVVEVDFEGEFSANGYDWVPVRAGERVGVAARFGVALDAPGNSPPVATKKIGLHLASGDKAGVLEMVTRLKSAGRPVPVVLVNNDGGLADAIKTASPSTFVVFRPVFSASDELPRHGSVWDSGAQWFDKMWRHMSSAQADAYQFTNEIGLGNGDTDDDVRKFCTFYRELMDACNKVSRKCTIGDFSSGHVEPRQVEFLRPMFEQADAQGHVLNYHTYTDKDADGSFANGAAYNSLRWKPWVEGLNRIRIIFGESSHYHGPRWRGQATVNLWTEQQAQVADDARVIGACAWTAMPTWDWEADRVDLSAYEAWMRG